LDELREIGDDAFDGEVVDEDETEEYSDGEEEVETGDGSGDEASDDGNDNDDDVFSNLEDTTNGASFASKDGTARAAAPRLCHRGDVF
jgi:hypothetical protein